MPKDKKKRSRKYSMRLIPLNARQGKRCRVCKTSTSVKYTLADNEAGLPLEGTFCNRCVIKVVMEG